MIGKKGGSMHEAAAGNGQGADCQAQEQEQEQEVFLLEGGFTRWQQQ